MAKTEVQENHPKTDNSDTKDEIELPPLQIESMSLRDRAATASKQSESTNNPFRHIGLAGQAIRELQSLAGSAAESKIVISDELGRKTETTVQLRREFLERKVEKEFTEAINNADGIDQKKVEASLFEVRGKIEKQTSAEEKEKLKECETALEGLKHAPSAVRFAFAMHLANEGKLERAQLLIKQAAQKDEEASKDAHFIQFKTDLDQAIEQKQSQVVQSEELMLPLVTMNIADVERSSGNFKQAEEAYKKAIEQADALDQIEVKKHLESIAKERAANTNNPATLAEIENRETAWTAVAHAPGLTRINYADFLITQGRGAEAEAVLKQAEKIDPDLVKDKKEFQEMLASAKKVQNSVDMNPFQHLEKFKTALESKDIEKAREALKDSVKAADNIDRTIARNNKKILREELKSVSDPEQIKQLEKLIAVFDAFDHAAAFTRVALGRFELAAKNYNVALSLFEEAKKADPELASRKDIEIDKLIEASKEPSTWTKILTFTKEIAKELLADAAAIMAGAGAVVLTGWSGPGAIIAGGAAGAAAYTGVKWLMGEDIHWYTPVWGAIDGMSGGAAVLARTALVKQGGKLVSQQMVENAVLKTGGNAAALSGLEGLKLSGAAQNIASTGLKAMGKDIGLLTRMASAVPFLGTGNAEYRSALAAYRSLRYSNLGINAMVNGGTAASMSMIYRGTHEGYNYYNGSHESFSQFAKSYASSVARDTLAGVVMGGYADGYSDGLLLSATVNGIKTGFDNPKSATQFMNAWSRQIGSDMAFGSVAWMVGVGAWAGDRYIHSKISANLKSSFLPSSPVWSDAFYAREHIKNTIEPILVNLNKPVDPAEIRDRFRRAPGIPMI